MPGTYKPCPGCREKGYRRADSVCDPCKELLRLGLGVKAEAESKTEPSILYRLPSEWPNIYYPSDSDSEPDLHGKLHTAFLALAQAALRRAKTQIKPYDEKVQELPPEGGNVRYFSTYDERASVWTGSARIAAAITKLDTVVRAAVLDAYRTGERSGQNLLKQIASGTVTIAELNEAHIQSGRGKRR